MVQVVLRLLRALEAHALQRGLLRMAHAALHLPLAIRVPHPAGHRHHAVVLQHVGIHGVDGGIVDVGLKHTLAKVVEHYHARATTQATEGLLMQLGPGLRAGVEDQEPNRLAAVAEGHHEQAHAAILAGVRVADHGAGAIIDLGLFADRGLDHRAGFFGRAADQLAHEALDALVAAREATGVDQVLPDRHGVAAPREPQFDGVTMHGARAGRSWCRRRLLGESHAKVGGHANGRFCVDGVGADLAGGVGRRGDGGPIGIRRSFAGTRLAAQLRAKVGGHRYGRFCAGQLGTGFGCHCRQWVGDRRSASPLTWCSNRNTGLS